MSRLKFGLAGTARPADAGRVGDALFRRTQDLPARLRIGCSASRAT